MTTSSHACTSNFIRHCGFLLNPYPLFTHTPPGTSDEHLTVVKSLINARPEGAIIVTTPQEVALSTIRKEINFCHKMKVKILGIVENMSGFVCPCCQVSTCMQACYYWCWCSVLGNLIIPIDSLSISLGMRLSITLKQEFNNEHYILEVSPLHSSQLLASSFNLHHD